MYIEKKWKDQYFMLLICWISRPYQKVFPPPCWLVLLCQQNWLTEWTLFLFLFCCLYCWSHQAAHSILFLSTFYTLHSTQKWYNQKTAEKKKKDEESRENGRDASYSFDWWCHYISIIALKHFTFEIIAIIIIIITIMIVTIIL